MVHVVGFKIRLELASNTFISAELACNFPFFFFFLCLPYWLYCSVHERTHALHEDQSQCSYIFIHILKKMCVGSSKSRESIIL